MSRFAIFYADDDEDDLMFFNDAVEKISCPENRLITLHIHKNGESLLESIKNNKVENVIVFLDINMPRKSGFQLLEEIRNETETKQIPVIIYSTSYNVDCIKTSSTLGANFYVVKPYTFDDLMEMINYVLKINWDNHKVNSENFIYSKD
jgi:CheY-like chemotaxis protein